jgi:hypothetical protein
MRQQACAGQSSKSGACEWWWQGQHGHGVRVAAVAGNFHRHHDLVFWLELVNCKCKSTC